jgi:hypothetical protein
MKAIPTVHQLRLRGLKVRVSHQRLYYFYDAKTGVKRTIIAHPDEITDKDFWFQSHFGGRTVITIADEHGIEYVGESECSKDDRYVRVKGRKKALARAYSCYIEVNNI